MSIRIRQPSISVAPNVGVVNRTLGTATLSSTSTLVSGISGTLTKTLDSCSLTSGQIVQPKIYQEIWIYAEEKPKKQIKKARQQIELVSKEINEIVSDAKRNIDSKNLAGIKASIDKQLSLLELNYNALEAKSKLLHSQKKLRDLLKSAKEKAQQEVEQKLIDLEQLRQKQLQEEEARKAEEVRKRIEEEIRLAELARKEKEDLEDLNLILEHLLAVESKWMKA